MATITISRQFGSHGDTVAQILCERLGYHYFDKNLMLGLAVQTGLPPSQVESLSEEPRRARTLIERLFGNYTPPMAEPGMLEATAAVDREAELMAAKIRHLIQAAYTQGNVVIVGRGGQCVLHGQPGVLHVRLLAPLEERVRRHAERAGLSLEEARAVVLRRDAASQDWVERFYHQDSADPCLYDLIINTGKLKPVAAAEIIIAALGPLAGKA
jgi:cytidylate kinase